MPPADLIAWKSQLRPLLGMSGITAVGVGLLTGSLAAWAYYDEFFRPLAHSFGIWIVVTALLSMRQTALTAALRSVLSLWAAVLAFFVGKKVMYAADYPGMPYSIDTAGLLEWLVLAVVAGVLLGWGFHRMGSTGRAGAVSTAAAVGLLVADAYRRSSSYPTDGPVLLLVTVPAVVVVLVLTYRSPRQLLTTVLWTLPMAFLGWLLVTLPDVLEQLLLTGGL